MKNFYSLVVTAMMAISINAQTVVDFTFTGLDNGTLTSENTANDTTTKFAVAKNGDANAPIWNTSGTPHVRLYSVRGTGEGNTLTITPEVGKTILKVEFTALSDTPNNVSYVYGSETGSASLSQKTYTITTGGTSTGQLTIKNAHKSTSGSNLQLRLASIKVTFKDACPTITAKPESISVAPNAPATFSVTAQGYLLGEELSYQWEESTDGVTFTAIDGETASTLEIANASLDMNGYQYRVIVSNETCSVVSEVATLTVDPSLAVGDVNTAKKLVVTTSVSNEIIFGAKANVTIVNMNGQVVKTANVTEGTRLNVANLTKGMYVVTAVVNGKAVSQKIIKK